MDRNEVEKRVVKVVVPACWAWSRRWSSRRAISSSTSAPRARSRSSWWPRFEHEFGIEMDEDAALEVQTVGGGRIRRQSSIASSASYGATRGGVQLSAQHRKS